MPDLKIPLTYLPRSGKSSSNEPTTFEGAVIKHWKSGKSKKDYQDIINLVYEARKMSSYEFIMSSLTLEKKK